MDSLSDKCNEVVNNTFKKNSIKNEDLIIDPFKGKRN
jgi:hypothetical protein